MNEYTQEQQDMIAAASDLYEDGSSDKAIAIGLTQGDRLVAEMCLPQTIMNLHATIWLPIFVIFVP